MIKNFINKMIKNFINKLIRINLIRKIIEIKKPNFVILYYHRVIKDNNLSSDMGPNIHLCVKENEFEKQMNFIAKNYNLVSMEDLYDSNFKCDKFSVAVTFDDGYKDNFEIAYPILKRYKIPATIYLVSRNFVEKPWAWWIELWNYIKSVKSIRHDNKIVICKDDNQRQSIFFDLKNKIKTLSHIDQIKFFTELTLNEIRENHENLFLNLEDLNEMKSESLITLGSHTHDHLCFSNFNEDVIEKQISLGKQILEQKLNTHIFHFSYPYGSNKDINYFEHNILKKLKFKSAVTTSEINYENYSNFYLPRMSIGPFVSIEDFKRKLTGFDIMIKKIIKAS